MYHPAIAKYVQLRYKELIPFHMERAVENLKSALEDSPENIDRVNWTLMAKATGLERHKFMAVMDEESWTDLKFKAAIQSIAYCSDIADKKLEDYL